MVVVSLVIKILDFKFVKYTILIVMIWILVSCFRSEISYKILFSGFSSNATQFEKISKLYSGLPVQGYASLIELEASGLKDILPYGYYSSVISTVNFNEYQIFAIHLGRRIHVQGVPVIDTIKNNDGLLDISVHISVCKNSPNVEVYPFIVVAVPKKNGIVYTKDTISYWASNESYGCND